LKVIKYEKNFNDLFLSNPKRKRRIYLEIYAIAKVMGRVTFGEKTNNFEKD
jgi:hypothetical protein